MARRLRLKRQAGGFLGKFLDARVHGNGKSPKTGFNCKICLNEPLFDSLYEFARAKELLGTTDLTYTDFRTQYVWPVFGRAVAPLGAQRYCLREHIRPALRREAFIYELEQARREGHAPRESDIVDFCLGRNPSEELLSLGRETGWDVDHMPEVSPHGPESPIEPLDEIEKALYDPSLDGGVTRYKLVYWREAFKAECRKVEDHEQD